MLGTRVKNLEDSLGSADSERRIAYEQLRSEVHGMNTLSSGAETAASECRSLCMRLSGDIQKMQAQHVKLLEILDQMRSLEQRVAEMSVIVENQQNQATTHQTAFQILDRQLNEVNLVMQSLQRDHERIVNEMEPAVHKHDQQLNEVNQTIGNLQRRQEHLINEIEPVLQKSDRQFNEVNSVVQNLQRYHEHIVDKIEPEVQMHSMQFKEVHSAMQNLQNVEPEVQMHNRQFKEVHSAMQNLQHEVNSVMQNLKKQQENIVNDLEPVMQQYQKQQECMELVQMENVDIQNVVREHQRRMPELESAVEMMKKSTDVLNAECQDLLRRLSTAEAQRNGVEQRLQTSEEVLEAQGMLSDRLWQDLKALQDTLNAECNGWRVQFQRMSDTLEDGLRSSLVSALKVQSPVVDGTIVEAPTFRDPVNELKRSSSPARNQQHDDFKNPTSVYLVGGASSHVRAVVDEPESLTEPVTEVTEPEVHALGTLNDTMAALREENLQLRAANLDMREEKVRERKNRAGLVPRQDAQQIIQRAQSGPTRPVGLAPTYGGQMPPQQGPSTKPQPVSVPVAVERTSSVPIHLNWQKKV